MASGIIGLSASITATQAEFNPWTKLAIKSVRFTCSSVILLSLSWLVTILPNSDTLTPKAAAIAFLWTTFNFS